MYIEFWGKLVDLTDLLEFLLFKFPIGIAYLQGDFLSILDQFLCSNYEYRYSNFEFCNF